MYARLATTQHLPPPEALDPMRGAMFSVWHTEDDAASLDLRMEEAFDPQPFPLDSDLVYTVD